jgi:hypothetical protein
MNGRRHMGQTTTRQQLAAVVLGGALLLGACGGGDDSAAASKSASQSGDTASTPATTAAGDTTAMCEIFNGIASSKSARDGAPAGGPTGEGPKQPTTQEGWDERIARTAKLVDTVPASYHDEAVTYLALVKDRAQLAADNGYTTVAELPADVRQAFISDHIDEQQQANALIAFAKSECNLP